MQSMSSWCVHKPAFERTCRIDPQSAALDLRLFLNQWASVFHIKETRLVANARVFSSLIIRAMHYKSLCHRQYRYGGMEWASGTVITDENTPLELKAVDAPVVQSEPMPVWSSKSGGRWPTFISFYVAQAPQPDAPTGVQSGGSDLACKVSNSALAQILESAQRMAMKSWCLLATVAAYRFSPCGRKSGANERLAEYFQPDVYLHLLEESIAEAWVTRKPTSVAT